MRPETFSSIKLTTVLPNTKLENIVKSPAIAVMERRVESTIVHVNHTMYMHRIGWAFLRLIDPMQLR